MVHDFFRFLVETIGEILNRKMSTATEQLLKDAQTNLNQAYEADQPPEELIFELFKVPNKDEACIGKLISVSSRKYQSNLFRQSTNMHSYFEL